MSHNELIKHLAETRHELEKIFNQHTKNPELYDALRQIDDRIHHAMSMAHKANKEAKEGFEPESFRGRPDFNNLKVN